MQCVIRDARCTVCNCNQKYTAEHSQHVNMLHLQVWASVAHCRAYSVGTLPLASVVHAVQCFHEEGSWRPLSARWWRRCTGEDLDITHHCTVLYWWWWWWRWWWWWWSDRIALNMQLVHWASIADSRFLMTDKILQWYIRYTWYGTDDDGNSLIEEVGSFWINLGWHAHLLNA